MSGGHAGVKVTWRSGRAGVRVTRRSGHARQGVKGGIVEECREEDEGR